MKAMFMQVSAAIEINELIDVQYISHDALAEDCICRHR